MEGIHVQNRTAIFFVHVLIFIKKGGGDYPMPHILRNFSCCVWKKIREGWEQPNSKILRHLLTDLGLLREMCHLSYVIFFLLIS